MHKIKELASHLFFLQVTDFWEIKFINNHKTFGIKTATCKLTYNFINILRDFK